MSMKVDKQRCTGCGACIEMCPVNAITLENRKAVINDDCVGCQVCQTRCPAGAIESS